MELPNTRRRSRCRTKLSAGQDHAFPKPRPTTTDRSKKKIHQSFIGLHGLTLFIFRVYTIKLMYLEHEKVTQEEIIHAHFTGTCRFAWYMYMHLLVYHKLQNIQSAKNRTPW